MALPQHFQQSVGGTIDIVLPERPNTALSQLVTVRGSDGAVYVDAQTATLDAVDTTLSSAAAAGARTLAVTSAASIVAGRVYRVGSTATEQAETVRVRSVSGTTLTLARPTVHAHANGAAVLGTRLSFAVTGTQASTLFFGGEAEWNWSDDGLTRNRYDYGAVECTRRAHRRLATTNDLYAREPKLWRKVDADVELEEVLDTAYSQTLERLNPRYRVRTGRGSEMYSEATIWRALANLAVLYGSDYVYLRDYYEQRWEAALSELTGNFAADLDQDGIIEAHEGPTRSVRFARTG